MNGHHLIITVVVFVALLSPNARAVGPQRNGNDLALEFSTATDTQKKQIHDDVADKLFFFRYLRILNVEKGETNGMPCIRMNTLEPSSDMRVSFTVRKTDSLQKAAALKEGDGVAVSGRLKVIGGKDNTIVLDPVIVKHKDRLSPAVGKELLYEIDSTARQGTDTSTGEEIIKKGKQSH